MYIKRFIRSLMVVIVFVGMVVPMAQADVYWEAEQISKGMPGQSDGTWVMKTYVAANATRTDMGAQMIMIMDMTTLMIYQLNPAAKTYTQMKFSELGMMPGMSAEEAKQMQEMMKQMLGSIQVTPTTETKQIAGYNCTKYLVSMMMMNQEFWISKEIKEYAELEALSAKMTKVFEENPILKQMNITGLMAQLGGFPVQTVVSVMGGTMTTTLKSIVQKPLDPNLFKVPADYTLQQQ